MSGLATTRYRESPWIEVVLARIVLNLDIPAVGLRAVVDQIRGQGTGAINTDIRWLDLDLKHLLAVLVDVYLVILDIGAIRPLDYDRRA